MKSMTINEAKMKICFLTINSPTFIRCRGDECIAWTKTHDRIEREDHSGASEMMYKLRSERNWQEIKRSGPRGCMGIYYFEEMGRCSLIPKEIINK